MVTIYNAKKWFGQVVNIKDRHFEGEQGVLLGYATMDGGITFVTPEIELVCPYRVSIQYKHSSIGETFVRHLQPAISEFVPACPDCGSDYDVDHGYCPVCYCGHLVCVD